MKAIELMQKLGELVTAHGDIEVRVDQDRNAAGWDVSLVNAVFFVSRDLRVVASVDDYIVIQSAY